MYGVWDPIGCGGLVAAQPVQFWPAGRSRFMRSAREASGDAGVAREQRVRGRMGLKGLRGAADLSRNRYGCIERIWGCGGDHLRLGQEQRRSFGAFGNHDAARSECSHHEGRAFRIWRREKPHRLASVEEVATRCSSYESAASVDDRGKTDSATPGHVHRLPSASGITLFFRACRRVKILDFESDTLIYALPVPDERAGAQGETVMNQWVTDSQFRIYVFCSVVLSLEALALGAMTAARRAKVGLYANPEDVKVSPSGAKLNDGAEHPEVARIMRAHRNLFESLPLFFALGLIAVMTGAAPMGVKIAMITFTVVRVLHAIAYLNEAQPWRTIFFGIGLLSLVGLMIMSLMAIFAA